MLFMKYMYVKHLLEKGYTKPNHLQHRATHFVSAKAQAALIKIMKPKMF